MDIAMDTNTLLAIGIAVLAATVIGWRAGSWYRSHKAQRRMAKGLVAERKAGDFLKQNGYQIIGYQKSSAYTVLVQNKPVPVTVRFDFVVQKRGKTFVAEVKSGKSAPDIRTASTRRQLLEYALVARADGLLLVDMEKRTISEVIFPFTREAAQKRHLYCIWAVVLGMGLYWMWLLR